MRKRLLRYLYVFSLATLALMALDGAAAQATVVRFNSVLGSIDVRLYDTATPQTTANFLNYVNDGDYVDSFIHRSVPGFVVQGGGFVFDDSVGVRAVPTDPPVQNEPGISNLRGTIAMAKQGGNPNSATSQWFFNLADNSGNLDAQNGGFTAFGRVVGGGMSVVDAIAALLVVDASGGNPNSPFGDLPVRDYEGGNVFKENLVTFDSIEVLDVPTGDFNLDGAVDQSDLTIWESTLGSTTEAAADANGNGVVDGADFLIWQRSFQGAEAVQPAIGTVPEPSTFALLAVAGQVVLSAAGRRRRPR